MDQFSIEVRDFSLLQSAQGSSAHSLSCLTGKKALFPGVKRPGYEVDRSHSPTAQFKNEWSCTFTPCTAYRIKWQQFFILFYYYHYYYYYHHHHHHYYYYYYYYYY